MLNVELISQGQKSIKFFFEVFFVGTVLSTLLVYVSREKMKKATIYELDRHFKDNAPWTNNLIV